ncbi:DUF397 domain-containing protein [Spirillospora sp. NPDC029432]|uniref:DUF397 domain-containing protein n=1 Tax=Spirillospora sp. NPDC029432 TaxID=3154599 RepID=UPI003453F5C3
MAVQWKKSTHSGGVNDEQCVELARLAQGVGVRDSKNPDGGHLALRADNLAALLHQIKRGAYDA